MLGRCENKRNRIIALGDLTGLQSNEISDYSLTQAPRVQRPRWRLANDSPITLCKLQSFVLSPHKPIILLQQQSTNLTEGKVFLRFWKLEKYKGHNNIIKCTHKLKMAYSQALDQSLLDYHHQILTKHQGHAASNLKLQSQPQRLNRHCHAPAINWYHVTSSWRFAGPKTLKNWNWQRKCNKFHVCSLRYTHKGCWESTHQFAVIVEKADSFCNLMQAPCIILLSAISLVSLMSLANALHRV